MSGGGGGAGAPALLASRRSHSSGAGWGGAVAGQCGPREVCTHQVCGEAISPSSFLEAGSYLFLPVLLARTEEVLSEACSSSRASNRSGGGGGGWELPILA